MFTDMGFEGFSSTGSGWILSSLNAALSRDKPSAVPLEETASEPALPAGLQHEVYRHYDVPVPDLAGFSAATFRERQIAASVLENYYHPQKGQLFKMSDDVYVTTTAAKKVLITTRFGHRAEFVDDKLVNIQYRVGDFYMGGDGDSYKLDLPSGQTNICLRAPKNIRRFLRDTELFSTKDTKMISFWKRWPSWWSNNKKLISCCCSLDHANGPTKKMCVEGHANAASLIQLTPLFEAIYKRWKADSNTYAHSREASSD